MAFDTHASVKKLQEAGVPAAQAEAQVELVRTVVEENLATKQDLKEVESRLLLEIEKVRHEIELVRHDLKEMESRIIMRLAGIVVAGFTLTMAMFGVVIAMIAL